MNRSIPASLATAANLVASRTPYLTPTTFGARSRELGDVRAGDALGPQVQDDAQVGDRVGDGGVVVDPAFGGHVGVHRLVDHDHAGAVVLGVPGRLDGGGDVVADAGQQFGPWLARLALAAVSSACLASAWLSA